MSNSKETWYTSTQDGGISYKAVTLESGKTATVERVIFERFNQVSGVREQVSIHWTEVFKWADFDTCGGLGVMKVQLSDGTTPFASGRYFGSTEGGLSQIIVGCYGSSWLQRDKKVTRDERGFAVVNKE